MANNERVVEGARLSGEGHPNGTLVEFDQDVFPHVKGEIKKLNKEELDRVDRAAKANQLKGGVYHKYELTSDDKDAAKRDKAAAEAPPASPAPPPAQ